VTNASSHEYCHGLMQVASVGLQGTSQVIGRLFVAYQVDYAICVAPVAGAGNLQAHITEGPAASAAAAGSAFLGTSGGVVKTGASLATVATSTTFTLPVIGNWFVQSNWVGSVTVGPSFSLGANITQLTPAIFNGDASKQLGSVSSNQTGSTIAYTVSAAGTGAANTVTISGGLTNLAAGSADIFIFAMNPNIVTSVLPPSEFEEELMERFDDLREKVMRMEQMYAQQGKLLGFDPFAGGSRRALDISSDEDDHKEDPITASTIIRVSEALSSVKASSNKKKQDS